MYITPTPAFMEAVRQALGINDLIPGPEIVIPAMRDEATAAKIRAAHAAIVKSRAGHAADECAAEMKRQLGDDLTPADLGYDNIKTAAELIASEWKSWFDEESARRTGPHLVVDNGPPDPPAA